LPTKNKGRKATSKRKTNPQYNYVFRIPNTLEGKSFLGLARHYLHRSSYTLNIQPTDPKDGRRGKNGNVTGGLKNSATLTVYVRSKNGDSHPMGIKNLRTLRVQNQQQAELIEVLFDEVARIDRENVLLRQENDKERSSFLTAVSRRINAITTR